MDKSNFREQWEAICPDGVISTFSCVVPSSNNSLSGPSISDSGFPDELRDFVRNNKAFQDMHKEHLNSVWKAQGGTHSRLEKYLGGCACLLYYEMGPGMIRGSYDGLWLSLHKLDRHLRQVYPWSKAKIPIKIRVPYSVRSGMDRDVFYIMLKKSLLPERYEIIP